MVGISPLHRRGGDAAARSRLTRRNIQPMAIDETRPNVLVESGTEWAMDRRLTVQTPYHGRRHLPLISGTMPASHRDAAMLQNIHLGLGTDRRCSRRVFFMGG
jgi:hypothetical protein